MARACRSKSSSVILSMELTIALPERKRDRSSEVTNTFTRPFRAGEGAVRRTGRNPVLRVAGYDPPRRSPEQRPPPRTAAPRRQDDVRGPDCGLTRSQKPTSPSDGSGYQANWLPKPVRDPSEMPRRVRRYTAEFLSLLSVLVKPLLDPHYPFPPVPKASSRCHSRSWFVRDSRISLPS